jgi:dihydropteroate synthase
MMTIKIGDKLMDFSTPKIMGILNVTPDSFYSKSRVTEQSALLSRVQQFTLEGADIIDLGAVSTRPGAKVIAEQEEIDRLIPAVIAIKKCFPNCVISVDTFRSSVARLAVKQGADIINDVSGGNFDEAMFSSIAELDVPYVLTHGRGTSETMEGLTNYTNVVTDVVRELSIKLKRLRDLSVNDVIIDPGFGFAKTIDQNYELMKHLGAFQVLDAPILVGISRKSMVYKLLNTSLADSLNGTTALNMAALMNGASILRVHDVKAAVEVRRIFNKL